MARPNSCLEFITRGLVLCVQLDLVGWLVSDRFGSGHFLGSGTFASFVVYLGRVATYESCY